MKKGLFSVITLLLSLTCSIACFACTGVSDFDDSASDSSVVEEHVHEFDGIVVTTNPTKLVYKAKETFDMTGIQVSKHCTLAGCEGEEITEGITFEYEKEGATYLTGDMSKVIIKALDYTADLAITVNKIEVELPVIEDVEYTGSAITATVPESEHYTVENVGGKDVGEYEVKLTLTDSVNYKFKDVEGAVATIKYNITKVSNTVTLADVAAINCGETPAPSATALEDAVISYVYSATEDGEYTATIEGGFVKGTYYVKALATETDSYKATYSAAKSFTVTHKLASWNTEGADKDVALCACGATLTEKFSKKVTAARQDVVLTATTSAIVLTGVSNYASVKSIKYGEISLGTNIASLDKSAEALADAVHGEQDLTVVVVDSYGLDHTITVPVTIVTDSFSTVSDIIATIGYHVHASGETHVGKYYTLAGNISYSGSYACLKADGNAIDGQGGGNGFAGTFDGRGYTITGGTFYGGGLFGALSHATIKNVKFVDVNPENATRTLIAESVWNSTFENISISVVNPREDQTGVIPETSFGVISKGHCIGVSFKDVSIDMGEWSVPWIFGKGYGNTDAGSLTFENVSITAKSVDCLATHSSTGVKLYFGDVPGVKFNFSGTVIDAPADEIIDPKEPGWFLKLTQEPWSKFGALKAVTLVCGETEKDITEYAERVLDETSNGIGFGNLGFLTEAMYNKSATLKIEFDVGEGSVAKFDYKVGIGDVNVAVTLEGDRQDVILADSTGAKTAFTLNLGDYGAEDCTLTKVTYGSIELDVTEDGKVTISDELKNATHGEVNLLAVVSKGKTVYSITVPVTIVTESFSTVANIIETIGYHVANGGKTHEGKYYTLAGNISYSGNYACYKQGTTDAIGSQGSGNGFAGTFDGRNYTISGGNFYGGGLFGALCGARIKNLKFAQVNPVGEGRTLIAESIWNSSLENIEISTYAVNISSANADFGVIARGHCIGLTLKDVTINMRTSVVPWIFGRGYGNANSGSITFDNVSITAGAIGCLTINSYDPYVKLYPNQVSGLKYTLSGSTITAPEGTEIDPTAEYFEFDLPAHWSHFATVKSVQFVYENNTPVVLELSNITVTDGKMKIVGLSGCLDESMYNETVTLKIEFDVGTDNVAKFDYKVGVLDTNTKATLATRQDVILRDSEGAKSTFTLELGTTYSGATIKKVKYGTTKFDIGENNVISIPAALNNAAHGEQNLTVVITKDETGYTLTVPVTIVTETFSSVRTIIDTIGYKQSDSGKTHEGKYYTLAGDISYNGNYDANMNWDNGIGNGFAGTFDGRNHTITGGNMYGGGLFGMLEGATVKNLKFAQVNPVGQNRTLIAAAVYNSTLENIQINTSAVTVSTTAEYFSYFGVIANGRIANLTLTNVTIDMGESEIPWVFGKGYENSKLSNFTCTNVIIKVKSLQCLAYDSNSGNTSPILANNAVTGITVIESSKTAG